MTTPNDVLRLQGDYRIETRPNGQLVIDVSGGALVGGNGSVTILGNLDVKGVTTQIETTNSSIKDNTITLNSGEAGSLSGKVTAGTSGIKIARGYTSPYSNTLDNDAIAAFIEWNDNAVWNGTGLLGEVKGQFEFRVGPINGSQTKFSAIKVNAIRIDEASASTIGASNAPRLNIFGKENKFAVISVSGTDGYESRVIDDDDIPNRKFVMDKIMTGGTAASIVDGNSYVTIFEAGYNAPVSEIVGVLGASSPPSVPITYPVTDGTVVFRISESIVEFKGIQFIDNTIKPVGLNTNLVLSTNTASSAIVLANTTLFSSKDVPVPGPGQIGFYNDTPGAGGTGLYYVSSSTTGTVTSDEVVSIRRSLIYSLIF